MGAGSRIVDFDEAAELGLPVVGYLAYDHVGPARADGAAARGRPRVPGEPPRRLRDARPLRPRCRHRRGAGRRPGGDRGPARGGHRLAPGAARHGGADPPLSRPGALHRDGRGREGAHRRRRRVPVRAVAAGGAADVGLAARHLPRASARQPLARTCSCSSSTGSRSSAPRPSDSSPARTAARASARSPARPSRPRATSSGSSPRRRTAPST